MKKNFLLLIALFAAVVVLNTACSDEEPTPASSISQDDTQATSNEEETQSIYEDLDELGISALNEAFEGGKTTGGNLGDCAVVTHYPNDAKVVVDFGEGCEGPRGRIRAGSLIILYTGRHHEIGSVVVTEFDGFYVDGVKIEGRRQVTNISESALDYPKWNVQLTDGKVTWPDETFATRAVNRTKTWVRGQNILLDEFHLEGTTEGTTRDGHAYETEITDPVVFKVSCLDARTYIPVSGRKDILINQEINLSVDYGDGSCDNVVRIHKGDDHIDVDVSPKD